MLRVAVRSDDREDVPDDDSDIDDSCVDDELVFTPGQMVRHSRFGLGRVLRINPPRHQPTVVVQFNTGSCKTLDLRYANLEHLDFPD